MRLHVRVSLDADERRRLVNVLEEWGGPWHVEPAGEPLAMPELLTLQTRIEALDIPQRFEHHRIAALAVLARARGLARAAQAAAARVEVACDR